MTLLAPLKCVPVIVTELPVMPDAGVNEVTAGATFGVTVNDPGPDAVRPGAGPLVTLIGPLVAGAGQVKVSWVALWVRTTAGRPLASTPELELNPEPVIVTIVPCGPLVGENDDTASTVNARVVVFFPPGVTTDTTPVVAPAGIVVWIAVGASDTTVAVLPPISTLLAFSNLPPETVTAVPATPFDGVKLLISGGPCVAAAGAAGTAATMTAIKSART